MVVQNGQDVAEAIQDKLEEFGFEKTEDTSEDTKIEYLYINENETQILTWNDYDHCFSIQEEDRLERVKCYPSNMQIFFRNEEIDSKSINIDELCDALTEDEWIEKIHDELNIFNEEDIKEILTEINSHYGFTKD